MSRDEARQLLAAIVESSDAAIISKDLNGVVTSWNKAAERMFGYTAEEMIGRPVVILATAERANEMPLILERIRKGERIDQYETVRRAKDGRLLDISLAVSPIHNEAGEIVGASKIARDITDQKRMEEALIRQSELIARSNADLQEFAYITSHDLQEPLRTVSTFCELLRRRYQGKLDGDADEFIGYITHAATRMSELIADLLSYSRLNDFEPQVSQPAQPRAVIEFLIATSLRSSIENTDAAIEIGELPAVRVDRAHLALVFENLIENAIRYRGAEPPRIDVRGELNGREAWFSVRDNGIGIAEQYHQQIFGVFKRLHGLEQGGTGMGLAACRRIVERYRGRIWVESREGEGSTFRFILPAA
jgi:PAS domain S-box-containing protein